MRFQDDLCHNASKRKQSLASSGSTDQTKNQTYLTTLACSIAQAWAPGHSEMSLAAGAAASAPSAGLTTSLLRSSTSTAEADSPAAGAQATSHWPEDELTAPHRMTQRPFSAQGRISLRSLAGTALQRWWKLQHRRRANPYSRNVFEGSTHKEHALFLHSAGDISLLQPHPM